MIKIETRNKKKVNYDEILYIRISREDKEKCSEIAKYYGLPNVSTYFRELIKRNIERYEKREK